MDAHRGARIADRHVDPVPGGDDPVLNDVALDHVLLNDSRTCARRYGSRSDTFPSSFVISLRSSSFRTGVPLWTLRPLADRKSDHG